MKRSILLEKLVAPYSHSIKYFFMGVMLLIGSRSVAQGDLLITPLRIVLEGGKKSQEISLANVGKDTAVYAISVKDYRMTDDGSFQEIDTPDAGQNFAGPFIRIFPRRVTLAPNEAQVVKLQVTKTNQMVPGEYRSHLYFRAVPDEKPLGDTTKKNDTAKISISITPIFGITIPVIIRVGDNNSDVTLSNVYFDSPGDKPTLHVTFNRSGNMSVYGDLKVDYISPGGGGTTQVKIVKGIGVYTPGTVRHFTAELDNDNNLDFHKGKLHLAYKLQTNSKTEKTVEADLELK